MIITGERLVFFEVFWKSGALLGAALCVNGLLRKKSADLRRLVLSVAIIAMFVAALAWPAIPRWNTVTPAWLRIGKQAAPSFEPARPPIVGGVTEPAASVIKMTAPGPPPRSEQWAWISHRTPDAIPLIWVAGAVLLFARFISSLCGLRRLRYASDAVSDTELQAYLDSATVRFGGARLRRVTLLRNDSIAAPVTWGIARPVILLPAGFEQLPAECREAVLCHESAHIQGYDFLLRGLAEIARALIWFQPLIWIVWLRLREEQELVCDNCVLAAGARPSAYARLLMDWDLRPGMNALFAPGIAHHSCLKRRLYSLLDQDLRRNRIARRGILAAWFLGLTATLSVAAINLAPAIPVQPAVRGPVTAASVDRVLPAAVEQIPAARPERLSDVRSRKASLRAPETLVQLAQALPVPSPVAALQAAASQAAGGDVRAVSAPLPVFRSSTWLVTVAASVKDQNGRAIEGLGAGDFVLTEDGRPQAIRIFEFQKGDSTQGLGSYYVLGYYAMNMSADSAYRNTGITVKGNPLARLDFRAGYYAPSISSGGFDSNVGAHFTVEGVTDADPGRKATPPRVIFKKDPEYSEQARKARYSGTVTLLVEIGATGQVTSVTVMRGLGMGLDEKAVESLAQWKCKPGAKDGTPVAVQVQVDLGFRLL